MCSMAEPISASVVGWGVVSGATQAYKNREGFLGAWDWFAKNFWRKTRIAVTGPAGVGKTVLCDALTERTNATYIPPGQSEQVEHRKRRLQKKRLEFIVLPGQNAQARIEGETSLLKKPVDGIIYASSFGFATVRDEVAKRKLIAEGQNTIEKFREAQNHVDLDHLEHTIGHVRTMFSMHSKPHWIIVAVTKLDLLSERDKHLAEEHYSPRGSGPFAAKMNSLLRRLGEDRFGWSVMPVCARREDFSWNDAVVPSHLSPDGSAESVQHFLTHVERRCAE